MKKRVVSFIIAFITMSTTISSIHANTASNDKKDILNQVSYGEWVDSSALSELIYGTERSIDFGAGGEWANPELYSGVLTDRHNDNSLDNLRSLPNKYDITEDPFLSQFFPSIDDQGEMNSCTGWASTYYQFTYEVNKLKNEPTNDNNKYSPAWTYNYINGGCNNYANIIDAYKVLKNSGAMKLTDFPCGTDPTTYSYSWSTNDSKMIEALNYRADPYYDYSIGSSDIYAIKNRIYNGQILVVWTDPLGWFGGYNNDGEVTVVRGSYTGHGHYMCIVGYDDTVQITNNAGVTLYGAFKLANSKGTSFANDGYIWVSYDALNLQTQHNNWDSSLNTLRTRIFGSYNPNTNQYENNTFYFRVDDKRYVKISMIYCIDDTDQEDDEDSYDYWYEDAPHNNHDNSLKYKGKDVWAFGIINNHDDLGFNIILVDSGEIFGDWYIINNKNSFSLLTESRKIEPFYLPFEKMREALYNVSVLYKSEVKEFNKEFFVSQIEHLAFEL